MLNIIELENRWLKWKIKSYLPYFIISISLVVIIVVVTSFLGNTSSMPKQPTNAIPVKVESISQKRVIVPKQVPIKKPIKKVAVLEKKIKPIKTPSKSIEHKSIKLTPSLDFMRKMQNSVQPYYINEHSNSNVIVEEKKPIQKSSEKSAIKEVSIKENTHKINIKRQNTQHDIQDIVKRFKNNNNPALSLFVAKKYYELGNYNQSYNYALITNKINKEIDVSWIIFTKSLVKLGKKDKAIATLKQYIKQSHSSSAQILLDEIRSGKFR